jgi:Fe-S cluster assembly iron-binding protein IscA
LDIDTNPPSSADYAFVSGGLRVVVLKRQVDMFRGAEIDYGEKDGRQGFLVNNPNFEGELLKKWGPIVAADPLSDGK